MALMNSCVPGAAILIPGGGDGNPLALTQPRRYVDSEIRGSAAKLRNVSVP